MTGRIRRSVIGSANKRLPTRPVATRHSEGFTIIELLIATAVFSTLLLLLTTAMIQIGRIYYKGLTTARTQEVARLVMEDITNSIQFGGGLLEPTHNTTPLDYSCVGDKVYSFLRNKQLTASNSPAADQSKNVLVVDSGSGKCGLGPQDLVSGTPTASSRELLAPNMRLAKLEIKCATGPALCPPDSIYKVSIRVVYGDSDMLCSPFAGDCADVSTSSNLGNDDISCKSFRVGTQFCAVSELQTVIQKRVE